MIALVAIILSNTAYAQDNTIRNNGEYYLYNMYYNRCLGGNEAQNGPALSSPGEDMSNYVWVAEASELHEGWFWLRHKSTGKYLQASNKEGDTWSCWFAGSLNKAYNSYEWFLTEGVDGNIQSNRGQALHGANKCFLGIDKGAEANPYINVYYDKALGDISAWQIVDARYALKDSRLKLYTDMLDKAIAQGEEMYANSLYGKPDELAVALYNARSARETASLEETSLMVTAHTALKSAITNAQEGKYKIILSGSSFGKNKAFTIDVKNLSVDNDELALVMRNNEKTGAVAYINNKHVRIGDVTMNINEPFDVLSFSFDGSKVTIYHKDNIIGTVAQETVPAITSVGTSAEISIIGEKLLKSGSIHFTPGATHNVPATNAYGKQEIYTLYIKGDSELSTEDNVDWHILTSKDILKGESAKISLNEDDTWAIFDNIRPSDVIKDVLPNMTIKGKKAVNGNNCRVAIYLHGTVVYPWTPDDIALYGYSGELYSGDEYLFKLGKNNNMGEANNELNSFILKRGYMVCFSTKDDGSGYSRVYVADHGDKKIEALPELLKNRISRAYIRKWNWVSKKGWCSTESTSAIEAEGKELGCTWYYTWSADRSSLTDMEYVPHKNHIYWPGWSSLDKENATAILGYNEPDHSEQHSDDCGTTIDAWKACTHQPEFMASGLRIGSPCPTDAGWLTQFIKHCDDMAYRCDFVTFHAYWGTNEAANSDSWWWQLEQIYKNTGRPIWLTEWNNGASWTKEWWPDSYSDKLTKQKDAIKYILSVLDNADFIERYSLYNWDSYYRAAISWDKDKNSWWVTPCGEVYRDTHPTHAYKESKQKVPVGWFPGINKNNKFTFTITAVGRVFTPVVTNLNGDFTAQEVFEYKDNNGEWKLFYDNSKGRAKFETTSERAQKLSLDECAPEALTSDKLTLRLKCTTLKGDVTTTEETTVNIPAYIKIYYTDVVGIDTNTADYKRHDDTYSIDGKQVDVIKDGNIYINRNSNKKTIYVKGR